MKNLTPYSGKFAGRTIESGKLSLDLEYKINQRKLKGENQIIIDNLTLGERVDSKDATTLPLDLALALLRNSKGVINLRLRHARRISRRGSKEHADRCQQFRRRPR